MKAHDYAPSGPINERPVGPYNSSFGRQAALLDALDGVPLGDHDRQIVEWICLLDDPTVRTVVSLILRARAAGPHPDQPRKDA